MAEPERSPPPSMTRRPSRGWVLGVCAGFAEHFEQPLWLVRLLWVASILVTAGLSVVAYFVLAGVLSAEEEGR